MIYAFFQFSFPSSYKLIIILIKIIILLTLMLIIIIVIIVIKVMKEIAWSQKRDWLKLEMTSDRQ